MKKLLPILLLFTACRSAPKEATIPASLENGKKVFAQHCTQCHPQGKAGLGPALNNKPAPAFLVKRQIRWGLGSMPSFKKDEISDQELRDLTAYVLQLRKEDQDVSKPQPQ
jgi:mono/diheme cytochrome c family protein